tara:strand:- start:2677 stop:3348 length:672 start_codon:yes stop_codon:yes gene_type:complete
MGINNLTIKEQVSLLQELYKSVSSKGTNGDTTLAHINEEEAALLKAHGGSGTVNPSTGLIQYGPIVTTAVAVYSAVQQNKQAKKAAKANRAAVERENQAAEKRNNYNKILEQRKKVQEVRQARIKQGTMEGATAGSGMGAGGTSSFVGATGSIGTQTAANLGNSNVATQFGDAITGDYTAAASFKSDANSAMAKGTMWTTVASIANTIGSSNIFGNSSSTPTG